MVTDDYQLLEYKYDSSNDVLNLRVKKDYNYEVSLEVNPSLIIDVSKDKEVVAFEILDASHFFGAVTRSELENANIEITVNVNEDVIKSEINLIISILKTRRVFSVSSKTINDKYAADGTYKYSSVEE